MYCIVTPCECRMAMVMLAMWIPLLTAAVAKKNPAATVYRSLVPTQYRDVILIHPPHVVSRHGRSIQTQWFDVTYQVPGCGTPTHL